MDTEDIAIQLDIAAQALFLLVELLNRSEKEQAVAMLAYEKLCEQIKRLTP